MSKMLSYRPDIDSLRALAVLSVILFHFNKAWIPGGFLGVDIFFVISGFLITAIIHREMVNNKFSFKAFYIRRIKRILPAFFMVVLFTVLLGAYLFTKDDFSLLLKSALASMGFAANLYYARGQGYFDPAQEEKPLLHIWSLSVEEQYYFIFPILLLFVIKRSWRTQFIFLALLMLLSIGASFISTSFDKYYLPQLRAFEMLSGALTAVWIQYQIQQGKSIGERYAAIGALVSLIILFICLFGYSANIAYFPGIAAIIPCLAASGYLYFNRFEHPLKPYFQWKISVAIGLISYSLYLWHWPLLAFARYIRGETQLPTSWLAILTLAIFTLSILSYLFIEKPFKQWQRSFAQSVSFIYFAPTLAISALMFVLLASPMLNQYNNMGLTRDYSSCHNNFEKRCIWGDETQKPEILVLGDSHADHYKTFFDYLGKQEHWAVNMVSADSCAYVEGYEAKVRKTASCEAIYRYAKENLPHYPIVILSMRWGNQLLDPLRPQSVSYDKAFFSKLDAMLAQLSQQKKAIYLFTDNPNSQYSGLRAFQLAQKLPNFHKTPYKSNGTTAQANQKISKIAAKYPNVHIVDVAAFIPDNLQINGLPIYSDLDHINPYGANALAKLFSSKQKLLKP